MKVTSKLADLRKCIARVARYQPPHCMVSETDPTRVRFVALWQARNRRTRVAMFRAKVGNA